MTARTSASARSSSRRSDRAASAQRFIHFFDRHIRDVAARAGRHSDTEQAILLWLETRGEATASEIARGLALDRGYLSRILQAFRRNALIAEGAAADRRARFVRLTPRGRKRVAALQRERRRRLGALFDHLSAADAQALVAAMRRIEVLLSARP
jgi:DNA-binding MarR family transcriptional regulator